MPIQAAHFDFAGAAASSLPTPVPTPSSSRAGRLAWLRTPNQIVNITMITLEQRPIASVAGSA
jgi:hypothetical protein